MYFFSYRKLSLQVSLNFGAKLALNYMFPGSGALVDTGYAIKHFRNGNYTDGVNCVISGLLDIASCGLSSAFMEETKKNLVKTFAEKISEVFGKHATKEVVSGTCDFVWRENARMSINSFAREMGLGALSSGGYGVGKSVLENVLNELLRGVQVGLSLIKYANVANVLIPTVQAQVMREAEKRASNLMLKQLVLQLFSACAKGVLTFLSNMDVTNPMFLHAQERLPPFL